MEQGRNNPFKINLFLIFIGFILSSMLIITTTPIHEAAHWIMSDIDPYIEPIEIHIFDDKIFLNGQHILSSALGYVLVKEKYPGAFEDRPFWADGLQEIICISIQILITVMITLKVLIILKKDYLKEIS
jgi:hypothetical protein